MKYNIAYFGTPYFSGHLLELLLTSSSLNDILEIKTIVSQPDKPVGKKQILTPSSVTKIAIKYNIPLFNELDLKAKKAIESCDFCLVYAYGFKQLIPKEILKSTRIKFGKTNSGFINIHPSLLPLYRGSSPITYPLILGDTKTGVTLFVMDEKMDHGPIIFQTETSIDSGAKRPDMEAHLTGTAFKMLNDMFRIPIDEWVFREQNHDAATHARYMTKDDGYISLSSLQKALNNDPLTTEELPKIIKEYISKYNIENCLPREALAKWGKLKIGNSSKIIFDYFRGMYPWPGIWTRIQPASSEWQEPKRLKITDISLIDNKLVIHKVQLEGKNEVDFKTFTTAYRLF